MVPKWVHRVQCAERAGLANCGGEAREGEPELPLEEGLESVVGQAIVRVAAVAVGEGPTCEGGEEGGEEHGCCGMSGSRVRVEVKEGLGVTVAELSGEALERALEDIRQP